MDKSNFKKLALMGMAGGMLLATQSPLSADILNHVELNMGHNGCGGSGNGCGGGNGYRQNVDDTNYQPSNGGGNGCAGRNVNRPSNPNYQSQPSYNGGSNACNGSPASRGVAPSKPQMSNPNMSSNGCGGQRARQRSRYTADAQMEMEQQGTLGHQETKSDVEFMGQLNDQGKAIYRGLDPEGKALAQKLSSQYQDKNKAVKEAAEQRAMKRTQDSSMQKGY